MDKAYGTHGNMSCLLKQSLRAIADVPPRTNVDNVYLERDILSVKSIFGYAIGKLMYLYIYI